MKRWQKRTLAAVIALPVLIFAAILIYAKVINKADEEAADEFKDRAAQAQQVTTAAPTPTTTPAVVVSETPATVEAVATTRATTAGDPLTGAWTVDGTGDIYVGYRVEEVLAGVNTTATGRTTQVTGSTTFDGLTLSAAEFTADVASITSDQSRRDGQFTGRIMQADQFPTASFRLTQPVTLASAPAEAEVVDLSATGDLTLHGVTTSVTFDLQGFVAGGKMTVTGSIPILFADYAIEDPSIGPVATEDNGLLEFLLVLTKG
jgi:polyisoprenoid-binding protein YceI